jgi:chromosome segregation ATPase
MPLDAQISMLANSVEKLNTKLDDIKDSIADVQANLSSLEAWKTSIDNRNPAVENDLSRLESRVHALELDRVTNAKIEKLEAKIIDQDKAMTEQQKLSAENKLKDKLFAWGLNLIIAGGASLAVHYLGK